MTIFRVGSENFMDCILQDGLQAVEKDITSDLGQRNRYSGRLYFKVQRRIYVLTVRTCLCPHARFSQLWQALKGQDGITEVTFTSPEADDVVLTRYFRITERPSDIKMDGWIKPQEFTLEEV